MLNIIKKINYGIYIYAYYMYIYKFSRLRGYASKIDLKNLKSKFLELVYDECY